MVSMSNASLTLAKGSDRFRLIYAKALKIFVYNTSSAAIWNQRILVINNIQCLGWRLCISDAYVWLLATILISIGLLYVCFAFHQQVMVPMSTASLALAKGPDRFRFTWLTTTNHLVGPAHGHQTINSVCVLILFLWFRCIFVRMSLMVLFKLTQLNSDRCLFGCNVGLSILYGLWHCFEKKELARKTPLTYYAIAFNIIKWLFTFPNPKFCPRISFVF